MNNHQIDDMAVMRDKQYADSRKLAARGRLHQAYSVAEEPWFAWLSKRLGIVSGDRVLDVGCGPAWFWAAVVESLPDDIDLTLIDISPGMVSEALERTQDKLRSWTVHGETADAQSLPFADASFDIVIAMHMLYHVPDQKQAIAEVHRVLKPGGTIAVTCNGLGNMRELYALTAAFGSAPTDPAAVAFGFDAATRLLKAQFGNVRHEVHPGGLRITDPEDVFLALTSFSPGDSASDAQLATFRKGIDDAFAKGGGALAVENEVGVFLATKS